MKKLTEEQKRQIKIRILVAGGYDELADKAVESICAVIEGRLSRNRRKRGRPTLSPKQRNDTIQKVEALRRRNPHLKSDRSISENLGINRRRVNRARRSIRKRRIIQFGRKLGIKAPAPKTVLSGYFDSLMKMVH